MKQYLKSLLTLTFASLSSGLYAQQEVHFTQFIYNKLIYNPAFAGTHEFVHANLFHRSQWIGFGPGAPSSQTLSADMPFPDKNIGVGMHFINDRIGIERNFTAIGSFAYKLKFEPGYLHMGVNAGVKQFRIDQSNLEMKQEERLFVEQARKPLVPDFGLGFLFVDKDNRWYAGISSLHLYQAKINYDALGDAMLRRQYFITGGYNYNIDADWSLRPVALIKYVQGAPMQGEINVRTEYQEKVWAGLAYRSGDAISFVTGVNLANMINGFEEQITIGYAFDWTVNGLPKYNTGGSHEIMVAYDIGKPKPKVHIPKFKKLE